MKKYFDFKAFLPHLMVIGFFAVLSVAYMSPILSGKQLTQSDPKQFYAAQTELRNFTKETGEWTGWTNSMFGGMPTYFIGGDYSDGIFYQIQQVVYRLLSIQGSYIFLYLLGAYLLLFSLGAGLWPSIFGAIGYAFFSYNILIIEAGHLAKVYALAFAPIILAGLALSYRGRMWLGAIIFSFGVGLELNANHFQITYYSAFIIGIFGIFELVRSIKSKEISIFLKASVLAIVMGVLASATVTSRVWTSIDHSKETNRGGLELSAKTNDTKGGGGLDKDYAYQWSYGKLESLTLLIPNFSGGASSGGALDEKSEVYKTLSGLGVDPNNAMQFTQGLPTYWGDQTFSGGPSYAGAIVCFLFILGLFYADKRYKWAYLVSGLLCMTISWGGNFTITNDLFFDYLPMFNKFRSLSMIMSLTQLCFMVIAGLGLKAIMDQKPSWDSFKKPFYISLGLSAGVCLILALMPSIFTMTTASDQGLKDSLTQAFGNNQAGATSVYNALVSDRASLLRSDALRSLFFILIAAGILWAYITEKINKVNIVGALLVFFTLIDLWAVDKRFLNNDDFERKITSLDALFEPTEADLQILQDKDPNYRVLDVTSPSGPFQSSAASYYHKSIGGYHTVKLGRYTELIENQIAKNNFNVLNMLNTKYIISAGQDGKPIAQRNDQALGNAWTVSEFEIVNTAQEEMKALDSLNPAKKAIINKEFANSVNGLKFSENTETSVKLSQYKPNKLTYDFNGNAQQLVVFSENYYNGNTDWKSYIDGKEQPHFRVNYVLRAMVVPAGQHKIEFIFDPITVKKGRKIDYYSSIAWILMVVGALFMDFRNRKEKLG